MTARVVRLVLALILAALVVATAWTVETGWVHTYGTGNTLNAGVRVGHCGFEVRGDPGPFCVDGDE